MTRNVILSQAHIGGIALTIAHLLRLVDVKPVFTATTTSTRVYYTSFATIPMVIYGIMGSTWISNVNCSLDKKYTLQYQTFLREESREAIQRFTSGDKSQNNFRDTKFTKDFKKNLL